ncbi:MAG: ribonuclease R [Clostridia bacterium]|nr:ribonuclease R [Clostridia bacterium]
MTQKDKVLKFLEEAAEVPLLFDELVFMLGVPEDAKDEFSAILKELCEEGQVVCTKKKRYAAAIKMGYVRGRFAGTARGYGFVIQDEGEDIFIAPDMTKGALNGDIVLVKCAQAAEPGKRLEGYVVSILSRANHSWVGRFEKHGLAGFVVPDDRRLCVDLFIADENSMDAKDGDKVVAELLSWDSEFRHPEGKITEVLGNRFDVGVDILSVIRSHNIPDHFPNKVLDEAKKVAGKPMEITKERADFRNNLIITIDGADAKDLDDAVELTKLPNGHYRLGVHIADVGHFVPRGSALDKEAFARGTSVYLVDRVVPMLPVELSNGICSLTEGEDRLTLSVIIEIDAAGTVVSHEITKSVIRSSARMTYDDVTAILSGDKELSQKYKNIKEMLFNMKELSELLRKKREARGSIDFDFPEAKILLDEEGRPTEIKKQEQTVSHRIIESFMLCANETVAEDFFYRELPFVYRVHERPSEDKMNEFSEFVKAFGYGVKRTNNGIHPKEFQKLLLEIKDTREERIISTVMLRSLMKARYSEENLGHFGLSAKFYCHFTSPIRRYPDLVIHRIIGDVLAGKAVDYEELLAFTEKAAKQSSEREICAMEAERETNDMKKAEYMSERLGEVYEGVISSVTPFGMFVALENTVEGLVRIADLDDDYYLYDEKLRILSGRHSGKIYQIGDTVTIRVARASKEAREIDFVLAESEEASVFLQTRQKGKKISAKERAKQKRMPPKRKTSAKPYMKKKSRRKNRK